MDQYEHSRSEGKGRLWLSIAAVAATTLVAILLVPEDETEKVPAVPQPGQADGARKVAPDPLSGRSGSSPSLQKASGIEPPVERSPKFVEPPSSPAVAGPEGSVARAYLASAPDGAPAEVTAKARELQQQGLLGDAWLLYFKAARDGDAGAALELGRQADPALFDARKSALDRADPVQAHKWYSLAARAGSQEAAERLDRLLENLQKAADEGDERAALLLREWKTR
ncbi:MAG TPA: hypothetical protein EYP90_15265 [Chromatiaceae bacterium]|nr:hypothetical protein [Chromatiaceae bacterium]